MKIKFKHRGNFSKLDNYFSKLKDLSVLKYLHKYGEQGVEALKAATPVGTGATAMAWRYEIKNEGSVYSLEFHNDNVVNGWFNVAIMLDTGHGTGTGGWVEGLNYIEPAVRPIIEQIANELWMEVTNV